MKNSFTLKEENVVAINLGMIDRKSNTKYAWDESIADGSEPPLWVHEFFRNDGTPYKQEEVGLIKSLTKSSNFRIFFTYFGILNT